MPPPTSGAVNPPAGVFSFPEPESNAIPTNAAKVKPRQTWGGEPVNADGEAVKELVARSLVGIPRPAVGDRSELIKHRFLCRGMGCLLIGQTGQGKSSLSMQFMISFSLGKPLFGITPNGALKCLLIQGENDDGDLTEARDGVTWQLEAMGLFDDEEDARELLERHAHVVTENSLSGGALFESLDRLLARVKPDLIIIDPAFSYVAGDANATKDVSAFLRQGLNPLLAAHQCGCLLIHHTPKPPNQKGSVNLLGSAYAGHGPAEWANWARAVLTLEGIGGGRYKLHAAKRGGRLGWKDGEGKAAFFKVLEHTTNEAGFAWDEATSGAAAEATANAGKPGMSALMDLVPLSQAITKEALILNAQGAGVGMNKARSIIAAAVGEGTLFEWKVKVPGRTRAVVKLARFPQAQDDDTAGNGGSGDNVHG
ncbi:MAG: AAA family ATPase [Verrucomicrobiaceae bacterium]|nr:AAA family ATPase [Verrucomicrobiaceae bacterium]